MASLMLTLANPKAILFFLALLPTVIDLASMNALRFVEISAAMAVVLPAVLWTYVLLATQGAANVHDAEAVRRLNRGSGAAMAGAAIVVATRRRLTSRLRVSRSARVGLTRVLAGWIAPPRPCVSFIVVLLWPARATWRNCSLTQVYGSPCVAASPSISPSCRV